VEAGTKLSEQVTALHTAMVNNTQERKQIATNLQEHREDVVGRLTILETLIRNGNKKRKSKVAKVAHKEIT
jgi:hypothetical protein